MFAELGYAVEVIVIVHGYGNRFWEHEGTTFYISSVKTNAVVRSACWSYGNWYDGLTARPGSLKPLRRLQQL